MPWVTYVYRTLEEANEKVSTFAKDDVLRISATRNNAGVLLFFVVVWET